MASSKWHMITGDLPPSSNVTSGHKPRQVGFRWVQPNPAAICQFCVVNKPFIAGWWLTYPSEKYESQMGLLFPTERNKLIHVPNHQSDRLIRNF